MGLIHHQIIMTTSYIVVDIRGNGEPTKENAVFAVTHGTQNRYVIEYEIKSSFLSKKLESEERYSRKK